MKLGFDILDTPPDDDVERRLQICHRLVYDVSDDRCGPPIRHRKIMARQQLRSA
jgi:hypothetical protein